MKIKVNKLSKKPPKWMAAIERIPVRVLGARSGYGINCTTLAQEVFGESGNAALSGQLAFAYIWRRFGPTCWGSDDYKEIARWVLGTPMTDVYLTVSTSGSPLRLAFGFLVTHKIIDAKFGNIPNPCSTHKKNPQLKAINSALSQAMQELKRPVYVRDVPLFISGVRLTNGDDIVAAEASEFAGYGIDLDKFRKQIARFEKEKS